MNKQLTHADHQPSGIQYPLSLWLLEVEHAENLGGIIRLADALGVQKIYVSGAAVSVHHPKVKKTARSTQESVELEYYPSHAVLLNTLREQKKYLLGLELTQESVVLADWVRIDEREICLVVGSESRGIPEAVLNQLDQCVMIPMLGKNSSMNLTSACAIAIYDISQKI